MKVAITGGIGEGKSTVLEILRSMGCSTASADEMARTLFSMPDVNHRLAELANCSGPISSAELREKIASSPEIRRRVNEFMHPRVLSEILLSEASFIEIPLLLETCLQARFSQVWVVTCGEDEQRRRLTRRYQSEAVAVAMMAAQLPSRVKIPFADEVIRTNRSFQHVRRILSEAILKMSG
jgi:dephospho-CoA kinase